MEELGLLSMLQDPKLLHRHAPAPCSLLFCTPHSLHLRRMEELGLLSKLEDLKLLSKLEASGLTLSKIEESGLLSKAEKAGVLSLIADK